MASPLDLKLRCPIRAHADKCVDDGEEIGLPACRKDQTFKAIDKLNEEQYQGWATWTTTTNERRQPEDGLREKKAFWSWRKIYESLYPNTTDFPVASFATEQNDPGQANSTDKQILNTRPREKGQQAPANNTGLPSKLPTGHAKLWLMNPLSADLSVEQQRYPEPEVGVSLLETSTGPGSMAFSSTSGTADSIMPPTPSFTSLMNDPLDDWLLPNSDSDLYLDERVKDIIDGNPHDYFSREGLDFSALDDEEDS
ncbi:hypothetical protein Neosp_001312 [[Neocosmospora] mangrovei]